MTLLCGCPNPNPFPFPFPFPLQGSQKGKQSHIASAVEEICDRDASIIITKDSTVLIDDDANNIKIALGEGVRAIWLNPKNSSQLIPDILNLIGG